MLETAHFRVKIIVEELDENEEVVEVVSEQILADFPDDQDDSSVGQMSDDYYNKVVKNIRCG